MIYSLNIDEYDDTVLWMPFSEP